LLTVDAVRRRVNNPILYLRMPYARQDRVCKPGESLSIRMFADLINSCGFREVKIFDPHSDVVGALLNNCRILSKNELIYKDVTSRGVSYDYVVAPDAGAAKSARSVAESINTHLITMHKFRVNGEVRYSRHGVSGHGLVVDDICDGGATFLSLADALHTYDEAAYWAGLDLYVTHGIFSKGFTELFSKYNKIITTTSFHSKEHLLDMAGSQSDRLHIIEVL
jgi:ribose-phosphate pyrophosphokinase